MKGSKTKAIAQFLTLLLLFPLCFLALRHVTTSILETVSWDNQATTWTDQHLPIPNNSSHKFLTDLLTIPPTLWCTWYLFGSINEIRFTYKATTLSSIETLARWLAIAMATLTVPPTIGLLFFYTLDLILQKLLAIPIALSLTLSLFYWCLKFPSRRLRRVEAIYLFEKVKES